MTATNRPAEDPAPAAVAADAAAAANITLADGADLSTDDRKALAALFDVVWGRDTDAQGSIISAEILWATTHAGAQVTAAHRDGDLVGGTATFLGRDTDGLVLHSHLTGVLPDVGGQGVGWALKLHQRAWCLARGIRRVVWTFDPLIRRNAVFNLVRLGARPVAYLEDLYGPMADERNVGLPTDRLLVHWDLDDPRVVNATAGRDAEPRLEGLRRSGAVEVLTATDDDLPEVVGEVGAPRLLAQIPADVEGLRRSHAQAGAGWTAAFRATVGAAMTAGYRVTGVTRDGWYVLASASGVSELA